jgi:hypothetical protein
MNLNTAVPARERIQAGQRERLGIRISTFARVYPADLSPGKFTGKGDNMLLIIILLLLIFGFGYGGYRVGPGWGYYGGGGISLILVIILLLLLLKVI